VGEVEVGGDIVLPPDSGQSGAQAGGRAPAEGGEVSLQAPTAYVAPPRAGPERIAPTRDETAARLAILLVLIFAATILIHYSVMAALVFYHHSCSSATQADETVSAEIVKADAEAKKEQLQFVERIFNTLLPVIAGLVGTTVAYYFGREQGKEERAPRAAV